MRAGDIVIHAVLEKQLIVAAVTPDGRFYPVGNYENESLACSDAKVSRAATDAEHFRWLKQWAGKADGDRGRAVDAEFNRHLEAQKVNR